MSPNDGHLWIARRNPQNHLIRMGQGNLIIPGVSDPSELKDLVQAQLERKGLTWTDWNKYLEQADIDREYRVKLEAARLELRRRIEGQVPHKVEKFIPKQVI
jgi:hypothetical protein